MKKINMSKKAKIATVICGTAVIAGAASMIGFKAGGNSLADTINWALDNHIDDFSISHKGYDIVKIRFDHVRPFKWGFSLYRKSDE